LCRGDYLGLRGREITEEWRKLHNEKLHIFDSVSHIVAKVNEGK
jgi:hypothetical protein